MYGNVGLSTPRGSGTNGYVVRNLSFIRSRKDTRVESLDEAKANSFALANRKPNQEILEHEKKRQVELKCMAFQQKLEEAGRSGEEIEEEVNAFRQSILASIDIVKNNKNIQEHQTHHLSQAKIAENEKMMRALGINSKEYIEGAAFDRDLQEMKKRERIAQREIEDQKRIEEREKKRELNNKRNEKQRSTNHERDRDSVEKGVDRKDDNASDSSTESDSSRDSRSKRYYASRRNIKLEDSDKNENSRKKYDHSEREGYHDQKDHRMPRSPRRRQGSLTRRRNRDNSIPSSRRYRDGSLSPVPRNRDNTSLRRYRDDSISPRRQYRNHSPREISKYSERKSSLRSVSPPYTHEDKRSRNISGSDKRNDLWDRSPRSNYNEDDSSSRHYRYDEEDKSHSHVKRRADISRHRVRKSRSSSEGSDYYKNRRRRRSNTSDSELGEDRDKKKSRRNNDYASSSNSDSTEYERHDSKKYNIRS